MKTFFFIHLRRFEHFNFNEILIVSCSSLSGRHFLKNILISCPVFDVRCHLDTSFCHFSLILQLCLRWNKIIIQ